MDHLNKSKTYLRKKFWPENINHTKKKEGSDKSFYHNKKKDQASSSTWSLESALWSWWTASCLQIKRIKTMLVNLWIKSTIFPQGANLPF